VLLSHRANIYAYLGDLWRISRVIEEVSVYSQESAALMVTIDFLDSASSQNKLL